MRFLPVLLLIPAECYASEKIDYVSYTLKAFGSLLVVLALMFLAVYLLKRINIAGRFKSRDMQIVDKLYIDNKHYIVMVKVRGRLFLLGVGEGIRKIAELTVDGDEKSD